MENQLWQNLSSLFSWTWYGSAMKSFSFEEMYIHVYVHTYAYMCVYKYMDTVYWER